MSVATKTKISKNVTAMLDYARNLDPALALRYVRSAYAKVAKFVPPNGDPMLDFLRYYAEVRQIIAWRLAKKFGKMVELRDECFHATDDILFTVFLDRADDLNM
jgi:hypothetical protein